MKVVDNPALEELERMAPLVSKFVESIVGLKEGL
jgi:hypothetical protein